MKVRNLFLAVGLLFGFVACDDGPVEEHYAQMSQEGRTVNLTAHVTGLDSWPSEFSLVVAGFGEKEYAIICGSRFRRRGFGYSIGGKYGGDDRRVVYDQ